MTPYRKPLFPSLHSCPTPASWRHGEYWNGTTPGKTFPLLERCWGEGRADVGWHSVEDSGSDWRLLWRENDYLWKPVFSFEAVPSPNWIRSVSVWDQSGTIGVAGGSKLVEVYASGGACGVGNVKATGTPWIDTTYWPCAYGTPMNTGVRNIGMSVYISPVNKGTVLNSGIYATMKPIELSFSKLKSILRKEKIRDVPTLQKFLLKSGQLFTKKECRAYFKHSGYIVHKR